MCAHAPSLFPSSACIWSILCAVCVGDWRWSTPSTIGSTFAPTGVNSPLGLVVLAYDDGRVLPPPSLLWSVFTGPCSRGNQIVIGPGGRH